MCIIAAADAANRQEPSPSLTRSHSITLLLPSASNGSLKRGSSCLPDLLACECRRQQSEEIAQGTGLTCLLALQAKEPVIKQPLELVIVKSGRMMCRERQQAATVVKDMASNCLRLTRYMLLAGSSSWELLGLLAACRSVPAALRARELESSVRHGTTREPGVPDSVAIAQHAARRFAL